MGNTRGNVRSQIFDVMRNKGYGYYDCLNVYRMMSEILLHPTDEMLGAIHGCYPDAPDKHARQAALEKWNLAIEEAMR